MSRPVANPARCIFVSEDDLMQNDAELSRRVILRFATASEDVARAVLAAISTEWMNTGMGNEERIDEVYDREGAAIYRRKLVLAALGCPGLASGEPNDA